MISNLLLIGLLSTLNTAFLERKVIIKHVKQQMIEHTRLMERILKRLIGRKRAHRLSSSQAQTSQILEVQTSAQIFNHIRQREHLLATQLELGSGGETERNVRANLHGHVGLVLAELTQHVDASRERLV